MANWSKRFDSERKIDSEDGRCFGSGRLMCRLNMTSSVLNIAAHVLFYFVETTVCMS